MAAGLIRRFRQWFFARCLLPGAGARHERLVESHKQRLFSSLKPGHTIVELGPGTGPNFRYFPPSICWIGIEPNPHLSRQLKAQGHEVHDTPDKLSSGIADVVISTLVLCSVDDLPGVLASVRRLLKPGGEFLFLEHVAAPEHSPRRRTQQRIHGIWKWFGDGCDLCRETAAALREAGFSTVDLRSFELPELGPAAPHIAGTARN